MSHVSVHRTTLGSVNIDILKKALEVLTLEETNLEIRDYIEDWYGKKHTSWEGNKIIGAIFSKDLQKGVGVSIDKQGHLIFISHDRGPALEKVKARVEQICKLIVSIMALQKMGYEISILQEEAEITIFEGRSGKHKITVNIDDKGEVTTDFDGFTGKTCYGEAQKLAEELEELGVNVDTKDIQPKQGVQIEPPERQGQRE